MRRGISMMAAMAAVTVAAAPAMAQDTTKPLNWARMFFWAEDPLGLATTWFILLLSVITLGLGGMLWLKNRKSNVIPGDVQADIEQLLREKRWQEAIDYANNEPSFLGKVISSALAEAPNGYAAMERAIDETADLEASRMLRPYEYLNVMGQIGPMLGLFGTVYGMILAFMQLVAAGGRPDPAALAAGISTALVTTFWGLIVAMPAMSMYMLLRNSLDAAFTEGVLMAEDVIAPFKPSAAASAGAAPAPSSSSSSSSAPRPSSAAPTPHRPRATPKPEGKQPPPPPTA